jgi:ATP-dependent RNA helicase DDX54/DBP10
MKRKRAASPVISENEFDISGALAGDDDDDFAHTVRGQQIDAMGGISEEDGGSGDEEDEAFIAASQAASNRKGANLKGRTVKKGGGFQAMALNPILFKAITRKGFSVPTPIQRKTVPLILDGQDVVGMARTGSGKTAAFVIPMVEKLKAHSAKVGARALILSPSRELALQTLKVVKELGRGTDLRTILLVGGDNLEDQFNAMTSNPDILIATPGRFHHLKVEMKLDLSSIQYVVFDEADRLFEMGFAVQLTEILHGFPSSRQTLLFSATLPKSLVEFARAGLQEPVLIRLDAESKVSPDLESAFFTVKSADKEGALLQIVQHVIKIPTGPTEVTQKNKSLQASEETTSNASKWKKRRIAASAGNSDSPTQFSTIVFAATKHHVEYLAALLRAAGYAVSYVYGALDQTARMMQIQAFREGRTHILVVTDVAARGIDIPILWNVINYDFPSQPKIFVHRVGRTARAGRKGWSYSLVQDTDLPYLIDLQLFLGRRLILGRSAGNVVSFAEDVVVGALPRDTLSSCCEWVIKLLEESVDVDTLRTVAGKGEKLYKKTRNSASTESVKRAKESISRAAIAEVNLLLADEDDSTAIDRENLLSKLSNFRPQETVFEIGKRGTTDETAEVMRRSRSKLDTRKARKVQGDASDSAQADFAANDIPDTRPTDISFDSALVDDMDEVLDDELEVTVSNSGNGQGDGKLPWQTSEYFMSYTPKETNLAEDRGYGVHSGSNTNARHSSEFMVQARNATLDLTNDEAKGFGESNRAGAKMRWDKKSKKYVSRANDEDGSRGAKMIAGESGLKIAASLRSGRFDAWKKSNQVGRLPRIGEDEKLSRHNSNSGRLRKHRHFAQKAPKEADKFRDDYHVRKKRVEEAKEKRIGRFKDGAGKNELRTIDDVRKQRRLKEIKQQKSARQSRKAKPGRR